MKPTSAKFQHLRRKAGRPWRRLRARVLDRDGYLCVPCSIRGAVTEATEVDHINPLHLGGTDEMTNLRAICVDCHAAKTAQEISDVQRGRHDKPRPTFGADGWPMG